jgi:hypothetical protein
VILGPDRLTTRVAHQTPLLAHHLAFLMGSVASVAHKTPLHDHLVALHASMARLHAPLAPFDVGSCDHGVIGMCFDKNKVFTLVLSAILGGEGLSASLSVSVAAAGCESKEAANPLQAESLRTQAADAFEASEWAHCLMLLDQAKVKDPKGDDTTAVKDMRRIATRKLGVTDASRPGE